MIPDDPFERVSKPKLDALFVQSMMQAVQTGVSLLRLQHELGEQVDKEDLQQLINLQRSVVTKLQNEQSRRRKKAKDMEAQREHLRELDTMDVPEDDDEPEGDLPPF